MITIEECNDIHLPPSGKLAAILNRQAGFPEEILSKVSEIIKRVDVEGDNAVADYTEAFDKVTLTAGNFRVPQKALEDAREVMDPDLMEAVAEAEANIRTFHCRQRKESWFLEDGDGVVIGKRISSLRRVGICVPGGQTPLLSSLMMSAIPAQVAGVDEICVVTPPQQDGLPHNDILATAAMLGLNEVYGIGGAQAVAALAFGTETIPAVDKIVGPGGPYTVAAKQQVYGKVGIEMIPGPSEIAILMDDSANPRYVAADLLSQAEHGSGFEASICITLSKVLADQVAEEMERQLDTLPRNDVISRALENFGLIVVVPDLHSGVQLVNRIAPEHVEILTDDPWSLLGDIRNAGAVFLGESSSEPVGDYFAGTNHVLPTNGAARYASSLGVDDFIKATSVIHYTQKRLSDTGPKIMRIARAEDLEAHARAIQVRLENN